MSDLPETDPTTDLVEPEGVNAGSATSTGESPRTAEGADREALLRGDATGSSSATGDTPRPDDEFVGAPSTRPTDPGQFEGPPGQDTGSME